MTIKKKAEKITVQGILGMPDGEYIRYTEAKPSPRKPKKPRRMNGKTYPGASTGDALNCEIANLQIGLGQAMDTIGDINIELESHHCRLSKLEHTINGTDYTGLGAKVDDTRRWMGGVRNHLDALEKRTQELENSSRSRLSGKVDSTHRLIVDVDKLLTAWEVRLNELEKAKGGVGANTNSKHLKIGKDLSYSENSILMAQLLNANKELETLKNQYRTLADAYAEKEREVKALKNMLDHERADGRELIAKYRELSDDKESLKAEISRLEKFLLNLAKDE